MKFPIEHADKLLFLNKTIRSKEYLVGSKRFGHISYQSSNPYITLEAVNKLNTFYSNNWLCELSVEFVTDVPSSFNGYEGTYKSIGQWSAVYNADFLGDLDSFFEDVTYLWYKHQT